MSGNVSIRRLKQQAKAAAAFRKHEMKKFETVREHIAVSHCKNCDMQMCVNTNPAPNEIDIGGEAVAVNCPKA